MDNVVARIQTLLVDSGFPPSAIACAAAKAGDFEILENLHKAFGNDVFAVRSGGLNGYRSAYEYAAEANQVEVLRWLQKERILPPLGEYSGDDRRVPPYNETAICPLIFVAAKNGWIDTVEFIADEMPRVRTKKIEAPPLLSISGVFEQRDAEVKQGEVRVTGEEFHSTITYAGVLATCIGAARLKGMNDAKMLDLLRNHLASGPTPGWTDLKIALRLDLPDVTAKLLDAGAKLHLVDLLESLRGYLQPVAAMTALSSYLEGTGKGHDDIMLAYRGEDGRGKWLETYADMLESPKDLCKIVMSACDCARNIEGMEQKGHLRSRSGQGQGCTETVRLLSKLVPVVVSSALLSRVTSMQHHAMMIALLEHGVDPNQFSQGPTQEIADPNKLPIHEAQTAEAVHLLHRYGADVNRTAKNDDQKNLFTIVCDNKNRAKELVQAFLECGGDLGRKFRGMTVAALAKTRSPEFKEYVLSVKTGVAVNAALDSQTDQVSSKPKTDGLAPL